MAVNFGDGFSGMSGMNTMGMGGGMSGSGNVFQYYQSKYGCEDCFRKSPYIQEFPKPFIPEPKNSLNPSWWQRFLHNVFGG